MSGKPYHHGDLKNKLIEAGIELINEQGEKNFSLRKVAALCGVSHSAPYSHFKSKEELIKEMQEYVTKGLMEVLEKVIELYEDQDDPKMIFKLGKAYIMFFVENPQYFSFLFNQPLIQFNLSIDDDGSNNYPPLQLFKTHSIRILRKMGVPEEKLEEGIIMQWASVQGVASIATMKNVHYSKKWEDKVEDIINISYYEN